MVATGLLRRMGQQVESYEIRLAGSRAESHPMILTDIVLEHHLAGPGLNPVAVRQAIAAAAAQYSPVVVMVGKSAKLAHNYVVTDSATRQVVAGSLQ